MPLAAILQNQRVGEWVSDDKWNPRSPEGERRCSGRYTHRVAISNSRLVSLESDTVVLTYKDYRRDGEQHLLRLPAHEFIRRCQLHILPDGFVRIRYSGLFANRYRAERLEQCRQLLGHSPPLPEESAPQTAPTCPHCGEGSLRLVGQVGATPNSLPTLATRGPP